MSSRRSSQAGFTLVELMLAMAIFSFVLVIMSSAILHIYNIYESGVQIRATQQAARSMGDILTTAARSAVRVVVVADVAPDLDDVCILNSEAAQNQSVVYTGTAYYVGTSGGAPVGTYNYATTQYELYSRNITLTYNPPSGGPVVPIQSDLDAPCNTAARAIPTSSSNIQQISPDDVSMIYLVGDDTGGNLLDLQLSLASNADLTNIASVSAAGSYCNGGVAARYCSITNLVVAAGDNDQGGSY